MSLLRVPDVGNLFDVLVGDRVEASDTAVEAFKELEVILLRWWRF